MRHCKRTVRFGRQRSHYKATLCHLVSALVVNKRISTTKVKAKEASRIADKLVNIGKDNTLFSRRKAYRILRDRQLVSVLFNEVAPLFKERNGGYTRIMLTGKRKGDNAQMAILEFVEKPKTEPVKKKEERKKAKLPRQEAKTKIEKIEEKKAQGPEKEAPKKIVQPEKEPKRPKEKKEKHGFFKKFFGWKDK